MGWICFAHSAISCRSNWTNARKCSSAVDYNSMTSFIPFYSSLSLDRLSLKEYLFHSCRSNYGYALFSSCHSFSRFFSPPLSSSPWPTQSLHNFLACASRFLCCFFPHRETTLILERVARFYREHFWWRGMIIVSRIWWCWHLSLLKVTKLMHLYYSVD